MLTLTLPHEIATRIADALKHAGHRECGGILMAEHVGVDLFVVREITIHRPGTFAAFMRGIGTALAALYRFFERTKQDYARFNYIGEWHSHPSFEPLPSEKDHCSMYDIVSDSSVGANFVVLVIVKLDPQAQLVGTVHTYFPEGRVLQSVLKIE